MNESPVSQTGDVEQQTKHIVEFDQGLDESVTTQLAVAVAEASDQAVTELPPLGECVDCDAIEQLFAAHDGETELSVSFGFEGYQVFVSSIGRIVVTSESADAFDG